MRSLADEVPFDIPDSWEWVRLGNISSYADTGHVDNELFITEALYNEFAASGAPHPGDLMVTAVGTLGKTYIVKDGDRFYYKDASVICFENFGKVIPEYLKLLMSSLYMEEQVKQNSAGTTVGTITIVKANEYLIPLPPLVEQQRIVEQIGRIQTHIKCL